MCLRTNTYGQSGPLVVVLHGGPGAPGHAAPLARRLGEWFRVIEPWQRGSGPVPLTVDHHVADLRQLMLSTGSERPPAIVGESWGAMLALAYTATHPAEAGPLVLIGCGTFDAAARARLQQTLNDRMDAALRQRIDTLRETCPDPCERLRRQYALTQSLYLYDPDPSEPEPSSAETFDIQAHQETWNDMLRLQAEGVYPAAFRAIRSPVLMLHGTYDPHPGRMILASLKPYLPQAEYQEWERCGHAPWRERTVRDEFFAVLSEWLLRQAAEQPAERR